MPYEIFISYSRDETLICDAVKALLEQMDYMVFVDTEDLAGGWDWRDQIERVLSQEHILPYVILLATRSAVARPDEIRKELTFAEEKNLIIIPIEFDAGSVKALLGHERCQIVSGRKANGKYVVDDRLENDLRKALNFRIKRELEKRRVEADNWISVNHLVPEPSFWGDNWREYFPEIESSSNWPASVALTARGGSGKSVLIAHCVRELLNDPTAYPFVLTEELLANAFKKIPQLLGARSHLELPAHLEALAKIHHQNIIFVVDGLDQMVIPGDPGQARLLKALGLLANSARLIIGCRKEYWDTVYAERVNIQEKSIRELDVGQVRRLLKKFSHLQFDPANALLRIPFFLDLTLKKAASWERVPETEIAFLQRFWTDILNEVSDSGEGNALPDNTRVRPILHTLAELQLERLTYEVPKDILKAKTGLGEEFDRSVNGLKSRRVVVERPAFEGASSFLRLRHDLLDTFAMVRVLLDAQDRMEQCKQLCRRADKDCGWTTLAMLVRACHHYGQEQLDYAEDYRQLQRTLFDEFLFILDHKKFSEDEMARAWAVTYVLKDCFELLFPFICKVLGGQRMESLSKDNSTDSVAHASRLGPDAHLTQEVASTLAYAFEVLREGTVEDAQKAVPILAKALNVWDLKARLLEALAKYRTDAALCAIVNYGTRQLETLNDEPSLLYVAQTLKYFDEPSAIALLDTISRDSRLSPMIRRNAAESLNHLRLGFVSVPERDEEEIIQGLRVKEQGKDRYSDWRLVKDYADYIHDRISHGHTFGPSIVCALVKALDHDHVYVRRPVAMALAHFDEPIARDALLNELLKDVVPLEVREACLEALKLQFKRCEEDTQPRQNFRFLCLRAARIADWKDASVTARELIEMATAGPVGKDVWLCDPLALEVVAPLPAGGGRVVCEILAPESCPPIEPKVIKEMQLYGHQQTGINLEPKYRLTSLTRHSDYTIHVQLTPTAWALGKGFHNAILENPGHFRCMADGSWIEPLPLGTTVLPGLAAVHAIVLTTDCKVLTTQRSDKVGYSPLHWSVSFEEQITYEDSMLGSDMFATAARRGFFEEFGMLIPPERCHGLSALLELDQLNLAVVVLLQPQVTFDQIRERWRTKPRPTHHWEANDVAFLDANVDVLQRIASMKDPLDKLLHSASGGNTSYELHPTSPIRCAMLARCLPDLPTDK